MVALKNQKTKKLLTRPKPLSQELIEEQNEEQF
jgi:hypothetical protein